jgi:hypothetical protein
MSNLTEVEVFQTRVNKAIDLFEGELEDLIVKNPHLEMGIIVEEIRTSALLEAIRHLVHPIVDDWIDRAVLDSRPEHYEEVDEVFGKSLNSGEERRVKALLKDLDEELGRFYLHWTSVHDFVDNLTLMSCYSVSLALTSILVKRMYDQGKIKAYPEGYRQVK